MNTDNKLTKQELLQHLRNFLQNHKTWYQKILQTDPNYKYLYDFIIESTPLLNDKKYSFMQRIHWVVNELTDFPRCADKNCNKKLDKPENFISLTAGYKYACCMSHAAIAKAPAGKATRLKKNNGKFFSVETLAQIKETFKKNWDGYDNNMKSPRGKKAYQQSISDKYGEGITNVFQLESVKQQIGQTKLTNYGDEKFNNPDKISKTLLSRTDEQKQQTREKTQSTNLKNFGETSPMKVSEIVEKGIQTKRENALSKGNATIKGIYYSNMHFDSYPEVCFYIWAIDNGYKIVREPIDKAIGYTDAFGKTHTYYPDFYIQDTNQLIEIKGDFFNVDSEKFTHFASKLSDARRAAVIAKFECMHKNGVIILTNDDYKKYLDYVSLTYTYTVAQQIKSSEFRNSMVSKCNVSK